MPFDPVADCGCGPSECEKHPGVYMIYNLLNGKSYVGSTTNTIADRLSDHRGELNHGIHDNPHLQHAWMKHGQSAFRFMAIELCDKMRVLAREQFWIDWLKPEYNICPVAGHPTAGRKVVHSPEHCAKLSAALKGRQCSEEHKNNLSKAKLGTFASDEARRHMSEAGKRRMFSPLHRQRLGEANKRRIWSDESRLRLGQSVRSWWSRQPITA